MSKETTPNVESEAQSYTLSYRYPDDRSSEQSYRRTRNLIFGNEQLELSVFRIQLGMHPSAELNWYVAVVGEQPPQHYDRKIRRIHAQGVEETLPEDVVQSLRERRTELAQYGERVEGRYRPGLRRRID